MPNFLHFLFPGHVGPEHTQDLRIVLAAVCTLALYTILYRENPIFRFFEHLFIGVGAGYTAQYLVATILEPEWRKPLFVDHQWWRLPMLLVGLMFYFIYFRRTAWIARLALLGLLALNAGTTFKGFVTEQFPQVAASFKSPVVLNAASHPDLYRSISNTVFIVSLLSVMSYFFFSVEHKGPLARSARLGRWIAMLAFGAIFATTIMARVSLFIGRASFLIFDFAYHFLGLTIPGTTPPAH